MLIKLLVRRGEFRDIIFAIIFGVVEKVKRTCCLQHVPPSVCLSVRTLEMSHFSRYKYYEMKTMFYVIKHHVMKTYGRSGSIAPHILNLGDRWG